MALRLAENTQRAWSSQTIGVTGPSNTSEYMRVSATTNNTLSSPTNPRRRSMLTPVSHHGTIDSPHNAIRQSTTVVHLDQSIPAANSSEAS